jgi:hypothetical protein
MVPALTAMIEGFEREAPGFDVNIGNLPYCIAPHLAPWIHHQGETTFTVSVNQRYSLSTAANKYRVQSRDKVKPASCASCVFNAQCSGVFETYERFYGLDELVPVSHARLVSLDPAQRLFTLHVAPLVARLEGWTPPAPYTRYEVFTNSREGEVRLRFEGDHGGSAIVCLRRGGRGTGGVAATDRFSMHLIAAHDARAAVTLVTALFHALCVNDTMTVLHPPGDDAMTDSVDRRIAACLERLRVCAPFGELVWREARVGRDGRNAAVHFDTSDGNAVTVSFALKGTQVAGSYTLARPVTAPSTSLVGSVRSVMEALRSPNHGG